MIATPRPAAPPRSVRTPPSERCARSADDPRLSGLPPAGKRPPGGRSLPRAKLPSVAPEQLAVEQALISASQPSALPASRLAGAQQQRHAPRRRPQQPVESPARPTRGGGCGLGIVRTHRHPGERLDAQGFDFGQSRSDAHRLGQRAPQGPEVIVMGCPPGGGGLVDLAAAGGGPEPCGARPGEVLKVVEHLAEQPQGLAVVGRGDVIDQHIASQSRPAGIQGLAGLRNGAGCLRITVRRRSRLHELRHRRSHLGALR